MILLKLLYFPQCAISTILFKDKKLDIILNYVHIRLFGPSYSSDNSADGPKGKRSCYTDTTSHRENKKAKGIANSRDNAKFYEVRINVLYFYLKPLFQFIYTLVYTKR